MNNETLANHFARLIADALCDGFRSDDSDVQMLVEQYREVSGTADWYSAVPPVQRG